MKRAAADVAAPIIMLFKKWRILAQSASLNNKGETNFALACTFYFYKLTHMLLGMIVPGKNLKKNGILVAVDAAVVVNIRNKINFKII